MKKLLALLLTLSVLLVAVPAMADTEGAYPVPAEGYDGSEVTIRFEHTMSTTTLTPVLDEYIAEFNKLYPNIHVTYEIPGSYNDVRDQIRTELNVPGHKQAPNMAYCYPDHVALYNLGNHVVTLDNFIDSQIEVTRADGTTEILGLTPEQKDDFILGFYEEGRTYGDGLMYTLPLQKSTEVLFYNKTFFEANDIAVPTTWDEMEQVCAKIKELDPTCIPLGVDSASNWFITMCEQLGSPYTSAQGDHYLFDNETNRAFVKRFAEWAGNGYLTTQDLLGDYTSSLFKQTDPTLSHSYMSIGSTAGAIHQVPAKNADGTYPFEVGFASIPQVDPANPKVISQGPNICLFWKENPQEVVASWLFLKFLTTNVEFQAAFSLASGYMPVINSVYENEVFAQNMELADGGDHAPEMSVKIGLSQQSAYYISPAFVGSTTARDEVGALLNTCLSDAFVEGADADKVINDAFEDAIEECEYND